MSVSWPAFALGIRVTALGQSGPTHGGKSPRDWVAVLRGDDPKARDAAASAILRLGPKAKEAVPSLILAPDDPRIEVQKEAVRLLGAIGPDAAPAAPKLASKLGDSRFTYSMAPVGTGPEAAWTLAAIGPRAVPALIDALGSDSGAARCLAARTLGQSGPAAKDAVPALGRLVKKEGALKGASAVEALGAIGPAAAEAIPILHAAYDALMPDRDDHTILLALSRIGAPPSPGLIRRLDDADPQRRVEVANLLRTFFGPSARGAARRLEGALNDPVPLVRVSAAAALASADPANPRALPALIIALDSTDLGVLEPAVTAIGELGPKAVAAVPKLKMIIGRNDLAHQSYAGGGFEGTIAAVKIGAAEALVVVSPHTGEGISAFLTLLKQGDNYVKETAIERLGRLGAKAAAAVPALAAIARDATSIHRYAAVKGLSRIDRQHETILPALIGLLNDPRPRPEDFDEEVEIITTLGLMGLKALPAVPSLVRVLEDKNEAKRDGGGPAERAARALGRIGPAARDAIPALLKAMRTEHYVRISAAKALVSMGTAAKPAVPDLIPLLESRETRPWAGRILGAIGPDARAAVPALVEALKDRDSFVAADVGSALLRIDPSQRGIVEARLAAIPQDWNHRYSRAILSGALGRRSREADDFTRQSLRMLDDALARWDEAMAKNDTMEEYAHGIFEAIEGRFEGLAGLGAGAAESVPRPTELVHHADPRIQRLAIAALKRIDRK
jgi:HEAT repeat protein